MDTHRFSYASHRLPRLHVITDVCVQSRWTHEELAQEALSGGAGAIQFREKGPWTTQERLSVAMQVTQRCASVPGAWSIVNDRLDVAVASDAIGVHLGAEDLPLDVARMMAPERIIGATAHTPDDVRRAQQMDIDYLGIGPVFGTSSKKGAPPPLGLDGLRAMVRIARVPIIAIGNITADNLGLVLQAGAYGVAVLSYVAAAQSPRMATSACVRAMQEVCL